VGTHGHTRPDNTIVPAAVRVVQKCIRDSTIGEARVILICHSRIDHDNVVLLMRMEVVHQLLHKIERKS